MKIKKLIIKLVKEELSHSVLDDSQKIEFLKDVYKNIDTLLPNEQIIISKAFESYFINDLSEISNCRYMRLQDLYNTVENKLKTQNIRKFHFKVINGKNVYYADLV